MDGEEKSTCLGVTHAIDGHITSRNTYGEAKRDLETICQHVQERLATLREFYVPLDREEHSITENRK